MLFTSVIFVFYELSRTGKDYWLHQQGVLSIRSQVSMMMIAFAIYPVHITVVHTV
jgi:hypothetical protein